MAVAATTRAAVVLLLIPGPLAEVLSQNTAATTFLSPVPFLLTALTYGVPMLLIREFAVAQRLDTLGIVVLGLGYGIFNEGIIAKTLTSPGGEGVLSFAGYGQVGPVQMGLVVFIVFWHALHSVLYPILLAHWLYPDAARVRWFESPRGRIVQWLLVAITLGLYSLYFLNPVRNDAGMFAVFIAATAVLVAVALRWCRSPPAGGEAAPVTYAPALLGAGMVVFNFLQLLAPGRVPAAAYFVASFAAIVVGILAMRRARWRSIPHVLLFGLGDATSFALLAAFMAVVGGRDPALAVATGVFFLVLFVFLIRAVRRAPQGRALPRV